MQTVLFAVSASSENPEAKRPAGIAKGPTPKIAEIEPKIFQKTA